MIPPLTEEYCRFCQRAFYEGDVFCRHCGVRKSVRPLPYPKPEYEEPEPVLRQHRCKVCGNEWETFLAYDRQAFCFLCGRPAPILKK